ncbi:hypothetical protein V8E55_005019 [Tylopilus felleus]
MQLLWPGISHDDQRTMTYRPEGDVDDHDEQVQSESNHDSANAKIHPRYAREYDEGRAADVLGSAKTAFESMKSLQEVSGQGAYVLFTDRSEWELANWLVKNVNQQAMDKFLKLPITREQTQPTYKSTHMFMKLIDQLPTGLEWQYELVHVRGDAVIPRELGDAKEDESEDGVEGEGEELELWLQDPVACVQELIGNAAFKNEMAYAPEKVYTDLHSKTRHYDEMWTGNWWWETQSQLPAGATVSPFKGDKVAWPVYLTIGNISKYIHCQPMCHASILVGYLPVSKLETFENNSVAGYCLFHYCMRWVVQNFVAAGQEGVDMVCADGLVRYVYPVLAAFIGDHPEQCLVACCAENRCPKCHVPADQRGTNFQFPSCNQDQTAHVLHTQLVAEGLHAIFSPFWANLPHANIFTCITLDVLHQLHQGIIKDHLKRWCVAIAGKKAFNSWFQAMPFHPGLRHWKNGISKVKQWTGADHKQLQWIFVTALIGTTPNHNVVQASRVLLNFVCLTQYHSHTEETLQALQDALNDFHILKDVFIGLGCCEHFNIPKLHSLVHYVKSIRLFGSLDGFNTEKSERLHIDYAKKAYAATNRKDYTVQMTKWLDRQEAVMWFNSYLSWHNGGHTTGRLADKSSDLSGNPTPYCVARHPHFPRRTAQSLVQHHGAIAFVDTLQNFLTDLPSQGLRALQPTLHDRFDCFNNVQIPLQPLEHLSESDNETVRICSHPECGNGPRKPPTQARYDTVLVKDDEGHVVARGALQGLRVAEVRVIFRLPPHLGLYPHLLAYVHLFKLLCTFDDNVRMFYVGHSTCHRIPNVVVVPITSIVQPCHLVPRFPSGTLDSHWLHGGSTTAADTFFLNRYINLQTFEQYRVHGEEP